MDEERKFDSAATTITNAKAQKHQQVNCIKLI
jgi:hypothetical protein